VRAASVARKYVVEREVTGVLPAVLALKPVAQEDVAARQAALRSRSADEVDEADYRRDLVDDGRAVQVAASVFQYFGLAAVDKYKRPLDVTDVQRFVVLIED
jgi:hypothetical protein